MPSNSIIGNRFAISAWSRTSVSKPECLVRRDAVADVGFLGRKEEQDAALVQDRQARKPRSRLPLRQQIARHPRVDRVLAVGGPVSRRFAAGRGPAVRRVRARRPGLRDGPAAAGDGRSRRRTRPRRPRDMLCHDALVGIATAVERLRRPPRGGASGALLLNLHRAPISCRARPGVGGRRRRWRRRQAAGRSRAIRAGAGGGGGGGGPRPAAAGRAGPPKLCEASGRSSAAGRYCSRCVRAGRAHDRATASDSRRRCS